jgi:selenocysteine lyase/cysteine desulfurase
MWTKEKNEVNSKTGSYGTFPSSVRNAWHAYQDENESRPDYFFQRVHPKRIDVARRAIARLVRAPVDECVFVKNASTGTNTVLRNLIFNQADVVVYFATVYDAVYKNLASLMETTPLQIRRVEYTFPITHDEIVRRFLEVVHAAKKEGLTVRAAVFDTIVSVPGARFPFEKLTRACREEGVLSIIDGAHGVGQIPLDLGELDPDFFVTNCHKYAGLIPVI